MKSLVLVALMLNALPVLAAPQLDPFQKYCEDQNKLGPWHRIFIAGVMASFGTDDCAVPQQELDKEGKLLIAGKNITDISLLPSLKNVRVVDLTGNFVRNISYLESMGTVEQLSLAGNIVEDVTALAKLTELKKLNLHGNRIKNVEAIKGLTKLESLDLRNNSNSNSNNGIRDYSPLERLVNLRELKVGISRDLNAKTCDFTGKRFHSSKLNSIIPSLTKLEVLHAEFFDFQDTANIEKITSLKELNLNCNLITKTQVLAKLPKLTKLSIGNNLIDQLAPPAAGSVITHLGVHGNKLSEASFVQQLPKVQLINLSNNRLVGTFAVPPVAALQDFRIEDNLLTELKFQVAHEGMARLDAGRNRLGQIDFSAIPKQLNRLAIGHNNIGDISGIGALTQVRELHIQGNAIQDFTPLNDIVASEDLLINVGDNGANDFSAIINPSIAKFYAEESGLVSLESLPTTPNLTGLFVRSNDLTSIAKLPERYPNLVALDLSENKVHDLASLSILQELTQLKVAGMKLGNLEAFAGLAKLRSLDVEGNMITDLTPIKDLRGLDRLYANGNDISDLRVFENHLWQLNILELAGNRISNAAPLASLDNLKYSRSLRLENNPLGTTIAKTEANCPTAIPSLALDLWCRD